MKRTARTAFTLMELMLSLALIVVITSLIGSLIAMYVRSFNDRAENIKQKQLARSLLTMMADDIRSVVTAQQYDKSVLEGMMGAGGTTSGTAGTSAGTGASTGTSTGTGTGAASGAGSTGTSQAGSGTGGTGTGAGATATDTSTEVTALPPGIYGSQYQLMVDVSRIPRSNEFNIQTGMTGMATDVPGDVKTVTYMMQSASPLGIQDSLRQVATAVDASIATNSGLVRQAMDRNVQSYSQLSGTSATNGGGDMIASEVVALEFAYFDGTQWLYQWDSSQQGLPWLIQISLALQDPVAAKKMPLDGGVTLQTMSVEDQQAYGVKIFQLAVAIPGAALQAATGAAQSTGSGMEAMGL